jgi:MerR family transcriptional regulator/heat shock protein HspR
MMIPNPYDINDDTPVYVISVAAQLSGLHPQTLRQYDRLGLVSPDRAAGRGRRYSARDIAVLREVQELSQNEGVNLAGIKRIRELQVEAEQLRSRVSELEAELARVMSGMPASPSSVSPSSVSPASSDLLPALPMHTGSALAIWKPKPR